MPCAPNPSDTVTFEVSYADDPVASVPVHLALVAASNTVVEIDEVPGPTENGSQPLDDPV